MPSILPRQSKNASKCSNINRQLSSRLPCKCPFLSVCSENASCGKLQTKSPYDPWFSVSTASIFRPFRTICFRRFGQSAKIRWLAFLFHTFRSHFNTVQIRSGMWRFTTKMARSRPLALLTHPSKWGRWRGVKTHKHGNMKVKMSATSTHKPLVGRSCTAAATFRPKAPVRLTGDRQDTIPQWVLGRVPKKMNMESRTASRTSARKWTTSCHNTIPFGDGWWR